MTYFAICYTHESGTTYWSARATNLADACLLLAWNRAAHGDRFRFFLVRFEDAPGHPNIATLSPEHRANLIARIQAFRRKTHETQSATV